MCNSYYTKLWCLKQNRYHSSTKHCKQEKQQYFSGVQLTTKRKMFMFTFWLGKCYIFFEHLKCFLFETYYFLLISILGNPLSQWHVDSNTEQVICRRHHQNLFSLSVCTISNAFCRHKEYQSGKICCSETLKTGISC